MFRIIKLAAYALLGYALYEFFQGLTAEAPSMPRSSGAERGGRSSFQERPQASGQTMTGGGEGMSVETQGADGGGAPHKVGRGVVSR